MAVVTKKEVVIKFVLELSEREAETLLFITGRIAGSPNSSPRKYVDDIRDALVSSGVNQVRLDVNNDTLSFKPTPGFVE